MRAPATGTTTYYKTLEARHKRKCELQCNNVEDQVIYMLIRSGDIHLLEAVRAGCTGWPAAHYHVLVETRWCSVITY